MGDKSQAMALPEFLIPCLQAPFEHLQVEDTRLADVFKKQLLPILPLSALARLRATSPALKSLVDVNSGEAWRVAGQAILTEGTLPEHEHGHAVQARLRIHAAAMHRLKSGEALNGPPVCRRVSNEGPA